MDSLPRPAIWRRYRRFWHVDVGADVDDELRFHLESRADELVGQGHSRESAAAQALAEMGNVHAVRADLRAIDRRVLKRRSFGEGWRRLGGDLGYAIRRLRHSPGFTIAATLTLTIAIGATASVFGLVNGVVLKAFPYRDPGRVLEIRERSLKGEGERSVPLADYLVWQADTTSFSALAAGRSAPMIANQESAPARVKTRAVTTNYFAVLGIPLVLGRALSADSGGLDEAIISYGYWQRRFGGATSVLGQALTLDDEFTDRPTPRRVYTVVGVLPAGLLEPDEVWTRLGLTHTDRMDAEAPDVQVYGRLKPRATLERVQRGLETVATQLAQAYPATNQGWSIQTKSVLDSRIGWLRRALGMLLSAAACVLLIGAANLANLFLVRCLARERELAVRTALGATRGRLMRELLIEASILGLVAGGLGVAVAAVGIRMLRALGPPWLPRLSDVALDSRVVVFCALASIMTVLIFGALPAWRSSRNALADFLKEGGRGTGSAQYHRLQNSLVVLQVAVALVLLTGAALLVKGFAHLAQLDPGLRSDGVLTVQLALPTGPYPTPERQAAFVGSVVEELIAQPGIQAASASSIMPGSQYVFVLPFTIVGDPAPDPNAMQMTAVDAVSPEYFRAMGIAVRRGRGIVPTDDGRATRVAIVDEVGARRFFGNRDPVGQRIAVGPDTMQVVGVASAVMQYGIDPAESPVTFAETYVPFVQAPANFVSIEVRTGSDPAAQTAAVKRTIAHLDGRVQVSDIQTLDARMARDLTMARFSGLLASLFATIALILGMVGIYSVLAYIVSQRRREIAVRIALGASSSRVMGSVLWRASALAGMGIVIGSAAAWALTRVLANLFVGVSPHDPAIFVGAPATFALVALAAASIPAFRTTRVNPVVALTSI